VVAVVVDDITEVLEFMEEEITEVLAVVVKDIT
jgi:hypothetical protein